MGPRRIIWLVFQNSVHNLFFKLESEVIVSIYFTFDRVESKSLDSHKLDRTYYFTINVFQETTTQWNIKSERNLCNILDYVINTFDSSDLWWLAMYIEEVWGNIQPVETDNWPALHAIVVLAIHTVFSPNI